MALNSPYIPEPVPIEAPTASAELEIRVGPAQPLGAAKGKVPPDQAHLITMVGVLGSVIAGITGAVLTLRISSGLTAPALAELALAVAAAALIATRRTAVRRAAGAAGAAGASRFLERQAQSRRPETSLAAEFRLNRLPSGASAPYWTRMAAGESPPSAGGEAEASLREHATAKRLRPPGYHVLRAADHDGFFGMRMPHTEIVLHFDAHAARLPSQQKIYSKYLRYTLARPSRHEIIWQLLRCNRAPQFCKRPARRSNKWAPLCRGVEG
jgi:hypothetical protein